MTDTTATSSRQVLRPATLAEARDALRDSSGSLLFRGGGTKLGWGAAPTRIDTVIDTRRLDRLLRHNPGDATATVQAGMPLARLQEQLAGTNQWLAIDPPHVAEGATVGGILAANDAGPRRLRYGTMRDLVIGTTVVLADGQISRSGGQVIKNVAGYDLAKLWCGCIGTLGLITEVVLRLHPRPAASATVRVVADIATATAITLELLASDVVLSALDWADGALWARVEGHPAAVQAQATQVRELATPHHPADVALLEDRDEAWERLVADLAGQPGETVVRGATLPSALAAASAALDVAAETAGVHATFSSHAGLGLHTARLSGGDATAHAAAVAEWRRRLTSLGGHAVVRRRLEGVDRLIDVWGHPPPAVELMRRVKAQLDPEGRCAPGRFVGGI